MSIFSKISAPKLKFSNFNLSEEMKCSMGIGDLVPILCKEVLPSDSFKVSTELLIKFAPLKAPVMHRIKAYVHYFFVPTYQVDGIFQNFINPKLNSDNSIILPYTSPNAINAYGKRTGADNLLNSLADYLGLPVLNSSWLLQTGASGGYVLVDPFRVYQHIYNCFYKDQNCEPDGDAGLFDVVGCLDKSIFTADELIALFKLRKRAWAKDYFTSALPSPQAGDDVLLPMSAYVESNGKFKLQGDSTTDFSNGIIEISTYSADADSGAGTLHTTDEEDDPTDLSYYSGLKVTTTQTSINDLRRALALQRFKELAERGGTRYSEMVRNFFGSLLKDYWVDRPIYLGGQVQDIKVGEVFQTSQTTTGGSASALATRGGTAQSYGRTKGVYLKAPCHGYIMGILSVRPEATYQQGVERMWSRKSIFDFAFPQFARMGEQEIFNKEIYAQGSSADDGIFGYAPRYSEYKTGHCHVCSEFRSSLSYWHFGRKFSELPTLSKEFVMMDNVSTDPFNVVSASDPKLYVDLYNNIHARRPLPYYGNPSVL